MSIPNYKYRILIASVKLVNESWIFNSFFSKVGFYIDIYTTPLSLSTLSFSSFDVDVDFIGIRISLYPYYKKNSLISTTLEIYIEILFQKNLN